MIYWSAPGASKPGFEEAVVKLKDEGKALKKGFGFGTSWTNHWVKVDITLPKELRGTKEQVICERFRSRRWVALMGGVNSRV